MTPRPSRAVIIDGFHKMATAIEKLGVGQSYHDVCLATAAYLGCGYRRVHRTCLMEDLPDEGVGADLVVDVLCDLRR